MNGTLNTAILMVILCSTALFCHSAEEFSLAHNLADDKVGSHVVSVKAGGIEILKHSSDSGVSFKSTPAGTFALGAGFPGMTKRDRMDSLLILDDEKDIKTFEHSFSCEDNGLKLKWVNTFRCHRDIPGVMVESYVINVAQETASCYQFWTTISSNGIYFTGTGKKELPAGMASPLISSDNWVFFQINDQGGIGMLTGSASSDKMFFSNFRNAQGLWGLRATTQDKSVFNKGQGSVLRFVLFFAVSPAKARELCDKIKNENIFPELFDK